jgi:hypothetical protein
MYNIFLRKGTTLLSCVPTEKTPTKRLLSFRGLLASLAIISLTITLASRTFHVSSFNQLTVKSASTLGKVQHRDKDASEWAPPLAFLVMSWVPEAAFVQQPRERDLLDLQYHCLSNRPPPTA